MQLPELDLEFNQHWRLDHFVRTHFTPDARWQPAGLSFGEWLDLHRPAERRQDVRHRQFVARLYSPKSLYSLLTAFDRAFWLQAGWGKHSQVLHNCPFGPPRLMEGISRADQTQLAHMQEGQEDAVVRKPQGSQSFGRSSLGAGRTRRTISKQRHKGDRMQEGPSVRQLRADQRRGSDLGQGDCLPMPRFSLDEDLAFAVDPRRVALLEERLSKMGL